LREGILQQIVEQGSVGAIEAVEALLKIDKAEFAARCAYYSMFYVAEALLYSQIDLKLN
jgi:uncharacterized protein (UPF0332 family)